MLSVLLGSKNIILFVINCCSSRGSSVPMDFRRVKEVKILTPYLDPFFKIINLVIIS